MAGGFSGLGLGLGRRRRLPPTADINVTSLVDVAFVLLIIFMIAAPMMQGGIQLELPRAAAQPLSARESIVVSVDRNGAIWIDQTRLSYDEFRASFQALVARRGTSNVIFRADRRAAYGNVVRVFAVMRRLGGENLKVSLVTEEEEIQR
ncbi:MAG TPA: biopolymer transporter ExbD [Gemmatimonadales bacterium]|nr:biopolymer transporter ExbD [Gemmatimonadales bacterium]